MIFQFLFSGQKKRLRLSKKYFILIQPHAVMAELVDAQR